MIPRPIGFQRSLVGLLLIGVTFAAFWPVLGNGFVSYDDGLYVTDNRSVQAGLTREAVLWAFSTSHASNWHPLTWTSHMLDCQAWGLNPFGHHLTSLLLHIANVLLLFLALHWMTGFLWRSAFVAALFAVHPLHVESVAWIAERKDVLSTLFWMLTMVTYVWYARGPALTRYLLVTVLFAIGLMAKPMLVTLPIVLLLLDYWPLGRVWANSRGLQDEKSYVSGFQARAKPSFSRLRNRETSFEHTSKPGSWRLVREKAPLLAMSAGSSALTYVAQQKTGAVALFEQLPLGVRAANALVAYVDYIGKMLWPAKLAVFYPHPGASLPALQVIGSGVILLTLTTVALSLAPRLPYLAVGWLWYVVTLVPVVGLVQVGAQATADRYTYVPLIGLFIIAAWGLPSLLEWPKSAFGKAWLGAPAAAVVLLLASLTWSQAQHWRDSVSLFEQALSVAPNSPVAHNNLGAALAERGDWGQAVPHFREALRLHPRYASAHNNLGNALAEQGRIGEAVTHFRTAIEIEPGFADAHSNLGQLLARQGNMKEGIVHLRRAVQLEPDDASNYTNLAGAFHAQGKTEEAIAWCKKALAIQPDHAPALNNLALVYYSKGDYAEAWDYVRLCRMRGCVPPPDLVRRLSRKMPEPEE